MSIKPSEVYKDRNSIREMDKPNTMGTTTRTAKDVISALNLAPHPEKGYYIETFRDPQVSSEGRAPSTYIYYLLEGEGGMSNWHHVLDAVEVWNYYAGALLQLSLSWNDGNPVRDMILGPNIWKGERPQVVVEHGEWQNAQSLGDWTLVGCSVAPGFESESFETASPGWEPKGVA